MVKIGVVGEDPHDVDSIRNLLSKRYKKIKLIQIGKGLRGDQLDTKKLLNTVKVEYSNENYKFIIFIRDLDGYLSEKDKLSEKTKWFHALNNVSGNKNIFLLNVWELEALIFADVKTINKIYKINYSFPGNPSMIKDPKNELKKLTRKCKNNYEERKCPQVFNKLNIDEVENKCEYFRKFLIEFHNKLSA